MNDECGLVWRGDELVVVECLGEDVGGDRLIASGPFTQCVGLGQAAVYLDRLCEGEWAVLWVGKALEKRRWGC